jgi:outer membrane murein-binding lipoprotein Lpp
MTQRERVLASSLLGVLILGGGAVLFQMAFLGPLQQLNAEIASLDDDIRKKDDEIKADQAVVDKALKLSPRLANWKQLSLPSPKTQRPEDIVAQLKSKQADYEPYLYDLLRRNGFTPGSIVVSGRSLEQAKSGQAASKGPAQLTHALPFSVQGQAQLDGIVKMLEEFHRANLLQQIRTITLQKPVDRSAPRGALDLQMTVEALLVNDAEKRDELMRSSSERLHVLADSQRSYSEMAGHNIFTGTLPAPKAATQSEDARDILGYIKLTDVSQKDNQRWEGWLYDLSKKDGGSRLRTSAGFNEFSFSDRYDNVLIKAVVIRIDPTGVLFRANNRFYHISPGDNLYDATREPAREPFPAAGAAMGPAWEAPW